MAASAFEPTPYARASATCAPPAFAPTAFAKSRSTAPARELLAAAVEHALHCAATGTDPQPGLDALADLADDPQRQAEIARPRFAPTAYAKAWRSELHPRGRDGRFISKDRIEAAKSDPKLARQLRKEVKPQDAGKLEAALAGHTDLGAGKPPTKKETAKRAAAERRRQKTASRDEARRLRDRIFAAHQKGTTPSADDLYDLIPHLSQLTHAELSKMRLFLAGAGASFGGARLKADRVRALAEWARGAALESRMTEHGFSADEAAALRPKHEPEPTDGRRSRRAAPEPAAASGPVAGAAGGAAPESADPSGAAAGQPARPAAPDRVPAAIGKVNRDLDRFGKLFASRGQHEAAGFMAQLKDHVNRVGVESALAALGAERGAGDGEESQYQTHSAGVRDVETGAKYMPQFCEDYLARNGITAVYEPDGDTRNLSSVAASEPHDPYIDGSFTPLDPSFKNKLEEAQHLPGLESSEDIGKLNGAPVTHMTPEVIAKLDAKYGPGKWIVKAYGDDAYAGYGIFFPQRSAQLHQDAKNAIWASGQHLAHYGFEHLRDEDGKVVGIKHGGGQEYKFDSPEYDSTIHGEARRAADSAMHAAPSEKGAELPGGGKEFMAQPAFEAVGVSDADRAAGVTIKYGTEGRTHIVTRNGKAELVPSSTWIKGEHLPVVFESEDTKAMAQAALAAINNLPESERQGQIYAPDIIKAKDGFRVVEANPTTEAGGGSGYLEDNPLVIDSYVSHLTGREPAHVRFVRNVLTQRQRGAAPQVQAPPLSGGVTKALAFEPTPFAKARAFAEAKHPRDHGKFASKPGQSGAKKSTTAPTTAAPKVDNKGAAKPAKVPKQLAPEAHAALVERVIAKARGAPKPTRQEKREARAGLARLGANMYRKNLVGNSVDRAKRRKKLQDEFGDGASCSCVYCGRRVGDAVGEGSLEQDKIYTTAQGGRYRIANLVPSCSACNKVRSDMSFNEAVALIKFGEPLVRPQPS